MRIAILTFHRAHNCGAMLQAWALKTVLERMGHEVEFPALNGIGIPVRWRHPFFKGYGKSLKSLKPRMDGMLSNLMSIPSIDIMRNRYRRFLEDFLPERECTVGDLANLYDLVVVGSDQVWSERHTLNCAPLFFGENLPEGVRKIVYAASYGDAPLDECRIKRVVEAVPRFDAVSVRETLAKDQLSSLTDFPVAETVDPTLLLREGDYGAIARGRTPKEPYLFMYTLDTGPYFVNTARELAKRLGVRCVIAPCYIYTRYRAPKGLEYGMSPDRLVHYTMHAKYVVAGSFHGTVMGLLFNKPFLSLRGQVDVHESRPASLLNKIGCGERVVNPSVPIDRMLEMLSSAAGRSAYERLDGLTGKSMAWLAKNVGFASGAQSRS